MVLIFVEDLWKTCLGFDIALTETVGSLKAQIQAVTGKSIAQQRLQHLDHHNMCELLLQYDIPELQDEKTLEFYGISKGTILFLSQATVTIFVMIITTKTIVTCDVGLDWNVWMLKDLFLRKEMPPPDDLSFGFKLLDDEFTLSSYGIKSGSNLTGRYRMRGGGGGWTALAYASVYHDWDGNMFSTFQGFKLIRGKAVVITGMVDQNWYVGRVPGEAYRSSLVFPSSYVKIEKFLSLGFQAAAPGHYPTTYGNVSSSEKVDAESVLTNTLPDESGPTPPLPAFKYTTAPTYFKCDIADKGSSFVSVTFTPDQLVIPGDAVRVKVKLLCLTHDPRLRIASVSLRVIVPDNEVRWVEPRNLSIGEGVVVVHRTDRANTDRAGELRLGTGRAEIRRTEEITIQRSGEEAIYCDIRGDLDNNNAVWSVKANGSQGIRGNVEQLSFALGREPREILYMCSVSAMMDGESVPITRHLRSGARSWVRWIGKDAWLSFLQHVGF